jgi:proton-dependent oligopeptide transporter, POT family
VSAPREMPSGEWFGHPRGLAFLFSTEMWERFSYYGMRALLVLYMVKYLFQPERAQDILGFATLKAMLEALFGPLEIQPLSSHVYGLYTALVYFTPILGGLLADRVLGQHRTVILGAVLMALGHFMMAFEPLFLLALLLLILGNGAFKPNISTQVGALYAPGDPRRDRAFSIFYVGINLGAFLAPLVSGTLGERMGWHYGFGAAGVGMIIGLAIYLYATKSLPPDAIRRVRSSDIDTSFSRGDWRAIGAIVLLALPVTFFWATYEQQGNTIALWADEYTDRTINLLFWTAQIPVTWFQAFNPFMIFAFTPLVLAFWRQQAMRGREPSTVAKMAYGCFGVAAANVILFAAALYAGPSKASWLWLAGYFVVITMSELYLSPIGLSLVTKLAPARAVSTMMGLWLATSFTGNLLAGYLGSLWSGMAKTTFFLMIAAIAAGAGLTILAFVRPLRGIFNATQPGLR